MKNASGFSTQGVHQQPRYEVLRRKKSLLILSKSGGNALLSRWEAYIWMNDWAEDVWRRGGYKGPSDQM